MFGSSAVYLKDVNGFYWISKWAPEHKLERLVREGELNKAKNFAKHYNLSNDIITQRELEFLVKANKNLPRIGIILDEIEDEEFLFDFSRKIQGDTDAGMHVLEHVDNLPVEDFLFHERREDQALRADNADWQNIIFSALTHGQHTYAKSELMKRAYMLSEMDVAQIFKTIPERIKCSELISLFSDLLPIFIRLYPLNIRRLLPTWVVDKVSLFETSDREYCIA